MKNKHGMHTQEPCYYTLNNYQIAQLKNLVNFIYSVNFFSHFI